jgi:hypothetical protein
VVAKIAAPRLFGTDQGTSDKTVKALTWLLR